MVYSLEELELYMNEALKLAEKALNSDEIPVGCVIVNRFTKEIESVAHNKTNCMKNGTKHCEIVALEKLTDKLVSVLELKKKNINAVNERICERLPQLCSSYDIFVTVEPCIMCIGFIDQSGIRNIYYGCRNDRFGGCGSVLSYNDLVENKNLTLRHGICEKKSVELLRCFYEFGNPKAPIEKRKRAIKDFRG
ncbi:cytidine deoxycytidylate deaminase family [Cryptosporidium bovis]|uniref:cytidine deoxycytidylate deaminase family n=1 Tax=Cryptosporidium bovis TaxID=310047 RepID=UPI00351AA291|nr:cytidine deoxycytidylate deaminase family [Cryptosporidium bovis]